MIDENNNNSKPEKVKSSHQETSINSRQDMSTPLIKVGMPPQYISYAALIKLGLPAPKEYEEIIQKIGKVSDLSGGVGGLTHLLNNQTPPPTKPEKELRDVEKKDEYEAFILWFSFPKLLIRLYNEIGGRKKVGNLGYNLDDEVFCKLLACKNLSQFAKEFKISKDTLTDWQKRPDFKERVDRIATANNIMRYKHDIDFSFVNKLMKHGDSARYKLFYQIHQDYKEKQTHEMSGKDGEPIEIRDAKSELVGRLAGLIASAEAAGNNEQHDAGGSDDAAI